MEEKWGEGEERTLERTGEQMKGMELEKGVSEWKKGNEGEDGGEGNEREQGRGGS